MRDTGRRSRKPSPCSARLSHRLTLAAFSTIEAAAVLPQPVKSTVSTTALAANAALTAIGLPSANRDVLGQPRAARYYSQMPMRSGRHVAKLAAFPDADDHLRTVVGTSPVAVADAVAARLADRPLRLTLAVQLRTDAQAMPVEDARERWPEDLSPYRPVGWLVLEPQAARDPTRIAAVEALSFAPGHALAGRRPLGAIARARMHVYRVLADERRRARRHALVEPASADAVLPW